MVADHPRRQHQAGMKISGTGDEDDPGSGRRP
jgi:hypothetical protein